jgi:hypothetical protein
VSIDAALWRGDIRLVPAREPAGSDRGTIESATLAADAEIRGTPCRAGTQVEFSVFGGLQHCTLAQRVGVAAETDDRSGGTTTQDLACAAGYEVMLRASERRLLERCVLAESATVGRVACGGGQEIVLDGGGLDSCTLASEERVGPFDLSVGTLVKFTRGRLDRFEMPPATSPVAVSGIALPAGSVVQLCDDAWEIGRLEVPPDRYVTIAGVKLTGGINFDCGKFQYGTLFEDSVLHDRRLPRGAAISADDVAVPASR